MKMDMEAKEINKIKKQQYQATKIAQQPRGRDRERCRYCGLTGVHKPERNCPAFGKTCYNCQCRNHFSSVCKKLLTQKDENKTVKCAMEKIMIQIQMIFSF